MLLATRPFVFSRLINNSVSTRSLSSLCAESPSITTSTSSQRRLLVPLLGIGTVVTAGTSYWVYHNYIDPPIRDDDFHKETSKFRNKFNHNIEGKSLQDLHNQFTQLEKESNCLYYHPFLKTIDPQYITAEMCLFAVKNISSNEFEYIPPHLLNYEMCKCFIEGHGHIEKVPEEYRTVELFKMWAKKWPVVYHGDIGSCVTIYPLRLAITSMENVPIEAYNIAVKRDPLIARYHVKLAK